MLQRLTREDISQCLGDVSDELAARILAIDVTRDELAAAARAIELGGGDEPSTVDSRIQELCRLIADELDDEIWYDR
ncbi:MAG TPA: hypothetical protein VFU21_14850 [Kofleriaceae bacterium]|nr:hypothetical protein [Kofleriaceae bacterium]